MNFGMIDKTILQWLPKRPKIVGVENHQPLLFFIVWDLKGCI